jgi:hypothetical protein
MQKVKIAELISQVSNECFSNATADIKENSNTLWVEPQQIQFVQS